VIFIETSIFTKLVVDYMTDEEYLGLQRYLLQFPDAGAIVPGSSGVRKLRWAITGRGKRGGLRVIYFWKKQEDEIWMLTLYAKSEASTIPSHMLRRIAEEIRDE